MFDGVIGGYSTVFCTRLPLAQPACVLWALEYGVRVQMRRWAERGVLAAVFERLRDRGSARLGHRDGDDAGQHLGEGTCGWDG